MQFQTRALRPEKSSWLRPERIAVMSRAEKSLMNWALVDDHQAVLEFGMGDGALLKSLMHSYHIRACGTSFDPDKAQQARQHLSGAEVIFTGMRDIPWRDNSFDRVFITATLPAGCERIDWPSEVLRTLKPGGKLLMALPILQHDGSAGTLWDRIVHPKHVLKRLSACGFDDVSYRYCLPAHAILIAGKPA